jgi:CRISPR/Cas system CMR-associated protein Cmr5 small subunit
MTHRGVKAGINELNELEETFKDNIQDVLERMSNLPEFIEYNNYLGNQLNTKKEGDSKLKKFMATIKEKTNGDDLLTNGIEKEKIKIRRKLQF